MHHIDGNHDNDAPENLVLIYHPDHMLLHAGRRLIRRAPIKALPRRKGPKPDTLRRGKIAYEYALQAERSGERGVWGNADEFVASTLGIDRFSAKSESSARAYAVSNGLRWPLKLAAGNGRPALNSPYGETK
jgi:hypothetical protein